MTRRDPWWVRLSLWMLAPVTLTPHTWEDPMPRHTRQTTLITCPHCQHEVEVESVYDFGRPPRGNDPGDGASLGVETDTCTQCAVAFATPVDPTQPTGDWWLDRVEAQILRQITTDTDPRDREEAR